MGYAGFTIEERVVLFADIHDFSSISRALGTDACDLLQEMYETLGDIIVGYGGRLVKYLGDALLCVFPEGSESTAVNCAQELRLAFAQLVTRRRLTVETELEIGIAAGPITSGTCGHRSLVLWDVFGEEINRAAAIGHHRGIAVTEPVCDRVKSSHSVRPLPDLNLKRESRVLKVWEIVG